MQVKYIALRPLHPETPALTPELLAASAARVSRNNTGIDEIMLLIDPADPEASTKRIFSLADYGHASIKGLSGGIALFLEQISLWQIYDLFRVCSCSDGQETSTRYVSFSNAGLVDVKYTGFNEAVVQEMHSMAKQAGELYDRLTEFWTQVAKDDPKIMGISDALIAAAAAGDPDAEKKVDRLRRNYVFDRARVVIPMAALNNMVLVQTARQWGETCTYLLSHYNAEARALGELIVTQLQLSIPNLLKHACFSEDQKAQIEAELSSQAAHAQYWAMIAQSNTELQLRDDDTSLTLWPPEGSNWGSQSMLRRSFTGHRHRYIPLGAEIGRCAVRFRIGNLGIAELRDLNRHRPGHKFTNLTPKGVYNAMDQVPADLLRQSLKVQTLFNEVEAFLKYYANCVLACLITHQPDFPYFYLLGHQLSFEHTTTLDKFIYTAEIRTGPGVHYRYCAQVRSCLHQLYAQLPDLKGLILEGSAEPE